MQASHAAGCATLVISSLLLTSCGLQDIAVPFPDRTQTSAIAPSFGLPGMPLPGFGERDPLPPAEQQCRKRLKRLGVSFRDLPPIRETATCGIDHPVEVAHAGARREADAQGDADLRDGRRNGALGAGRSRPGGADALPDRHCRDTPDIVLFVPAYQGHDTLVVAFDRQCYRYRCHQAEERPCHRRQTAGAVRIPGAGPAELSARQGLRPFQHGARAGL